MTKQLFLKAKTFEQLDAMMSITTIKDLIKDPKLSMIEIVTDFNSNNLDTDLNDLDVILDENLFYIKYKGINLFFIDIYTLVKMDSETEFESGKLISTFVLKSSEGSTACITLHF